MRQTLSEILQSDPDITVMGVAADPYIAAEAMESEIPDVITLDVEMPRMDGLTFLEKIMSQHPIPVVMCSSLTDEGCATALRAMECGAVTIITKPQYRCEVVPGGIPHHHLRRGEGRRLRQATTAGSSAEAAGTQAERRRDAGEGRPIAR